MIELDHLTVAFGRTLALRDVTLTIEPGVTGLFGPNASGKSTLLRTVAGFEVPLRGRVRVHGASSARELRAMLGWAGHDAGLYARMSVTENLKLFATLNGARPSAADDAVEALGLSDFADVRVDELSAGTKRRAAVARALVHDPSILLLDEPYANLDDDASEVVTAAIVEWSRRPGTRCAVVASHGAKRVKGYASASLILQRGRPVSYRVARLEAV